MRIFTLKEGRNLINKITLLSENADHSTSDSYLTLVKFFYQTLFESSSTTEEAMEILSLKRYHMQNGKTLWLCSNHGKESGAHVIDIEKIASSIGQSGAKNLLLEEIRILEQSTA